MVTNFDRAMCLCGLSTRAAAEIFDQPYEDVMAWRLGQKDVPDAAWRMLSDLYRQIKLAAELGLQSFLENGVNPLDFEQDINIHVAEDPLPKGASAVAGSLATLWYLQEMRSGVGVEGELARL